MKRHSTYFIVLALLVVVLFVADIAIGSVTLKLSDVWAALTGNGEGVNETIVRSFRLPKAIVAVLCGAGLSACGLQMQTLFKNPLAGPYILGVSSGASLGVSLFLLGLPLLGAGFLGSTLHSLGLIGSALIGAAAIMAIMMAVASRIKDIMVVLIMGMMFGSAATAIVEMLQYLSPESALKSFVIWTMGSLGGVSVPQLKILTPVVITGLAISFGLIKSLNLMLLGENYARTMGANIRRIRAAIFLSTILLAGTLTAFCGPIGFIGIAVPHLARMLFAESDHRPLMPASMLIGAGVLLLCDIISQVPGRDLTIPINTVTALLGIPIVIYVIASNRKKSAY